MPYHRNLYQVIKYSLKMSFRERSLWAIPVRYHKPEQKDPIVNMSANNISFINAVFISHLILSHYIFVYITGDI